MTRHRSHVVAASVAMLVIARAAVALEAPAAAATAASTAPASAPVAAAVAPPATIPVTGSIAGGDQGRSGSTTQSGPERPPAVVWSQPVAPNAVTEPIVMMSGGKAVVLVGSGDDLLALDARSGAPLWRSDLGMLVGAPPTIAGGSIRAHGLDGILRIVNPVTVCHISPRLAAISAAAPAWGLTASSTWIAAGGAAVGAIGAPLGARALRAVAITVISSINRGRESVHRARACHS